MLEEIPYSYIVSVTDEEPPTHHSLLINMDHRVRLELCNYVRKVVELCVSYVCPSITNKLACGTMVASKGEINFAVSQLIFALT